MRRHPSTGWAFHTSAHLVGWMPSAGSAVAVMLGLVMVASLWRPASAPPLTVRVVEAIVPLVIGLQAAFLLSPNDEPPLELLLTCPRPLAWALFERSIVLVAMQGSVALFGSLITLAFPEGEGLLLATLRWLAPGAWIGGVALFTTLLTRHGIYGALLVTLLWGALLFGGDSLLIVWPFLWPVHMYLQPDGVPFDFYAFNRITLTAGGLALTILAAYLTRDEERLLGMRRTRWMRR